MTDNSRAFLLISCGVILVSISSLSLVTSQNGAHDCSAAIAAPASSPLQAAQEYRDRAFDQLKEAEKKKTEEPERYSEALTQMASQAANYEMISKGLKNESDSQEGNKYFKLAIDFYCANKWGIKESDDVARTLWTASSGRSTAALEAVFERLFKASERHLTDDSDTHGRDLALWVALCQRQESMPLNDQKRLVERAIAIRKSALKSNRSRLLAPLYDNLAYCFGEAHDIKGAEASYITAVSMLDSDPVQQEHALVELAKFYVNNQMFAQADATWKRAAKLTIARRLVWYTSGYVDLIHLFKYQQQWSYTGPIFDTLLTHGDDFDFHLLDPELVEYVERRIKSGDLATAADLVKKRIAAAPGQGKRPGMEDWKIRLSNIYLAQGRTTESKALFDQVIADSVRLSLPTADWKNERARLMENLGLHDAAQKLSASTAASSSDIVLPSSLVVKGNIEFGPGSQVTSFDSSDHNDPALKGISGCYMRTIPPEGDGSILCLGNVTGESLQYAGTIYCRSSKVTSIVRRLQILPIEHPIQIPEGIPISPEAKTTVLTLDGHHRVLERGDYILTDLSSMSRLTIRPQISSRPIRIFLRDSPEKKDFEVWLEGQSLSFRQLQLWYRGDKTIRLRQASGLIYAPNARVELMAGTGFMGAIVCREFKTANGGSVWLDRGIVNRNLTR